jgi:hypothetical protein
MKREDLTNPQLRKHKLTSTETLGKTFPKFGFKKSLSTLSLSLKVMNLLQVTKVLGSTKNPTKSTSQKGENFDRVLG